MIRNFSINSTLWTASGAMQRWPVESGTPSRLSRFLGVTNRKGVMEAKKQETTEVSKDLTFKLTETEFADKGKKAAALNLDLFKTNTEFEDIKKDFKSRIAATELEIAKTLKVIREGEETRNVRCQMVKKFEENRIEYVFNGTVMESRTMEAYERQMEMEAAPQQPSGENVVPLTGRDKAFKDE